MEKLKEYFNSSIEVKRDFLNKHSETVLEAAEKIKDAYESGSKVLICGNGGSAADAQHLAAELMCRFEKRRKGLPAFALSTDTSLITAWSNDYSFETVFARQVETLGDTGDILIAISTSGDSKNVIKAVEKANELGLYSIGLLGRDGGGLKDLVSLPIVVSAEMTAHIQECHVMIYHFWCGYLEDEME